MNETEAPEFGCLLPGECCMPGLHFPNECHSAADYLAASEVGCAEPRPEAMNAVKNTITGRYLVGFADDHIHGPQSLPVWGHDKTQALPASVELMARCHLVGIFAVDVEWA